MTDTREWFATAGKSGMAYVRKTTSELIDFSTLQVIYGNRSVGTLSDGAQPAMPKV